MNRSPVFCRCPECSCHRANRFQRHLTAVLLPVLGVAVWLLWREVSK